ncbi:unnamed protein product [Camellia sinensis]
MIDPQPSKSGSSVCKSGDGEDRQGRDGREESVKAVAKVNPASAKEGGREGGGYGEGGDGEDESDRRGMTSIVLERAETLRTTGASIGMQSNGWHALDQLGVGLKLRQTAIPVLRNREA